MEKPAKVGIYKDTAASDSYILVIRTHSKGTLYFSFTLRDFLLGYDQEIPNQRPDRTPVRMRSAGVVQRLQTISGSPLDPYVCQALMDYAITPSFLDRCGNSKPKRVKWAERRKGGWGGNRR